MKIFLCGDVMTGRGIDQILQHSVSPELYEGYVKNARDYVLLAEKMNGPIPWKVADDYIWGAAQEIWKEEAPELKIINLETAVTTSDTPMLGKGINYRMHPDNLSVLKRADIDICTLANNHVQDWGVAGLVETISSLEKFQIKHSGAGQTLEEAQAPAIFETPAGRVLTFSMCHESSGVPWNWEAKEECPGVHLLYSLEDSQIKDVRHIIERYRRPGDLVIVSIHWGGNWGYEISQAQVNFAHALIDEADVDVIHGHSSHHPKGIEIYQNRPILYGCGDFINDYEGIHGYDHYRGDLSLMYFIECTLKPFKLVSLRLKCLQMKRFKLCLPQPSDVKWMGETLKKVSSPFATGFEETSSIIQVHL